MSSLVREGGLVVVIATAFRNRLLHRSLESLSECALPDSLDEVVVVENGEKAGAESVCKEFGNRLPIRYLHVEVANKSVALNRAFETLKGKLAVLFDDDVRFDQRTLITFEQAMKRRAEFPPMSFFAGAVLPDYEEAPHEELRPYLPGSVMGWSLGDSERVFDQPDALGANMAVFVDDALSLAGFSAKHGPGTSSRGQESEMQQRLLGCGGKGIYLPDAVVWHYVPKERCSTQWALKRQYQMGVMHGLKHKNANVGYRGRQMTVRGVKLVFLTVLIGLAKLGWFKNKALHWRFRKKDHLGFLKGMSWRSAPRVQ